MNVLDQIVARAARQPARIVLCESQDTRVLAAAARAARDGIAHIILLGQDSVVQSQAAKNGISLENINIIDPETWPARGQLAAALQTRRPWARMSAARIQRETLHPLHFANLLVRTGHADGSVAGAVYTSPDVMRSAIRIIDRKPGESLLSSFFLMHFDGSHHPVQGGMIFADCALNIDPTEKELAEIAISAANNSRFLLQQTPRLAMLSFSTNGSARHPSTEKVIAAARRVKEQCPDLLIDEDMQLDAAIMPWIAERKAPDSVVHGCANVLIFPNLDAGNIGYKMAERFGGATAIGPLIQGLKHPANDLSRGCSADDIYYAIAVTSLQAADNEM